MKIQAVSFRVKGRTFGDNSNKNYPFMYMNAKPKPEKHLKNYGILSGVLALGAVCVTLFNIKKAKKFPKDIVEITNPQKGFNKLTDLPKTIEDLKLKVIYPLKSACLSGNPNQKNFKSGIIFTSKKNDDTGKVIEALIEHVQELEIRTATIPHTLSKTNSKGEACTRNLRRNEIAKELFKEVKSASQKFNEEGQFTVINIGNIEHYAALKPVKSQKSKIEILLEDITNNKYPGIVLVAESNNPKKLPLFMNGQKSILFTKIMD